MGKTLKIGYDASVTLARGGGGIARYTLELLRALVELDEPDLEFQVLLNSLRHAPGPEHDFLFQSPRVHVVQRRLPGPLIVEGWRCYGVPRWEQLLRADCDVVHAPASYIPPADAPVVVTVHDIAFLRDETEEILAGSHFAKDFPNKLPQAAAILTPSRFVAKDIQEHYSAVDPGRIHAVHSGIKTELFRMEEDGAAPEHDVFAVTQHPIARKRADWVVPVCREAGKRRRGLKALAVGLPPDLSSPPVEALGHVPDAELARLYARAGLTLLTTREEGFGFPFLESLAMGTPVVCHQTSALTEIGKNWAHFTDEDTLESYAEKMVEVLENPPDQEWRRAASEYARSFTWQRAARRIATIYRAVAKG